MAQAQDSQKENCPFGYEISEEEMTTSLEYMLSEHGVNIIEHDRDSEALRLIPHPVIGPDILSILNFFNIPEESYQCYNFSEYGVTGGQGSPGIKGGEGTQGGAGGEPGESRQGGKGRNAILLDGAIVIIDDGSDGEEGGGTEGSKSQ